MELLTILQWAIGALLVGLLIYFKFVRQPVAKPTECESRCVDGVCFPSCNPRLSIGDHGSETMTSQPSSEIPSATESDETKKDV